MKRSENGQTPYQLNQLCPLSEPHSFDWFPNFPVSLDLDWFPRF